MTINRRDFLKSGGAAGTSLLLPPRLARSLGVPELLDPLTQPQFVNPCPNPLDPSFRFESATTSSDGALH